MLQKPVQQDIRNLNKEFLFDLMEIFFDFLMKDNDYLI